MKTYRSILSVLIFFSVFAIYSCSDSTSSNQDSPRLRLNASVSQSSSNPIAPPTSPSAQSVSGHVNITEAKFLVRRIEFKSALDQDSLDFNTEPFVLNLNLDGGITEVVISDIDPGLYDEIEFDIHKPEDFETPPDPEFRIGDSGDERFSIIIKGTANNESFVFRSNENFDHEIDLSPNLSITESTDIVDITLSIDTSLWFTGPLGEELDPNNPDQIDEIEESVVRSFEVFKDDDRDGIED